MLFYFSWFELVLFCLLLCNQGLNSGPLLLQFFSGVDIQGSPGVTTLFVNNEKRDNKQCLLDTPRRVTVTKKSEKNLHIYKSHGIIKN